MGSIVGAKIDIIKMLCAKIVDQGDMSYEMLDEINDYRRTAQQMKKRADEAAKLSMAHQKKMEAALRLYKLCMISWYKCKISF
jgi:hypothetical protein